MIRDVTGQKKTTSSERLRLQQKTTLPTLVSSEMPGRLAESFFRDLIIWSDKTYNELNGKINSTW